jgi:hypothetical protein
MARFFTLPFLALLLESLVLEGLRGRFRGRFFEDNALEATL